MTLENDELNSLPFLLLFGKESSLNEKEKV
jgi:hypothetical protein